MLPLPPLSTLFPYTTLFRSSSRFENSNRARRLLRRRMIPTCRESVSSSAETNHECTNQLGQRHRDPGGRPGSDRKSTRLNSSHLVISYAVFCLKKKTSITRQ